MSNLRLLLLENLDADAAFLSKTLSGKGFDIVTTGAGNDDDIAAAIRDGKIDAIITGNRVSDLTAVPAVVYAKKFNRKIPVIILTGSALELNIGMLMKGGADDCVMINDLNNLPGALELSINKYRNTSVGAKIEETTTSIDNLVQDATKLLHIGVWESNLADHSERWSDELYVMLGLHPGTTEPSLGNLLRRVHPEDVLYATEKISDTIEQAGREQIDVRIIANDNAIKYVSIMMAVDSNKLGKAVRVYGSVTDVTDKKAAELDDKRTIADLVQRNKDLEQFAYIISHNLRGPVANIVGVSKTLLEDDLDDDEAREFTDALSVSAQKLDTIITDLNQILQVKKQVNEHMEMVSFQALVDEIKSGIGVFLQDACIMITTDFDEVPEMLTLKSYMRSIFYNLISNSIKYRKPDLAPVIEIRSKMHQNRVELTFKDNSLGIDLDSNKDKVFGLYKRFHTDRAEGKGMGLYMVKTQVELLGGNIRLQSKVGEGTEFKIDFVLQYHDSAVM